PKRLIEGGDREADVVGTLHLEGCMLGHADCPTGKRAARLIWVGSYYGAVPAIGTESWQIKGPAGSSTEG
ncbi:hypothetical protein, partial [Methylobacterium mesophilicum]